MKLAQDCASAATPPDETSPGLCLCSHTLVQWPERLCLCSSVCLSAPVSLVGCMVCSLLVKLTAQCSSIVAPPQSGLSACCGVALVWSNSQQESVQFAWQHVRSCSCSPAGCSLLIKLPTWHCSAVAPPRLGVAQKSVHSVFGKAVSLCLLWGCLGTSQCESVQLAWQNVTGCSRSPAGSPPAPREVWNSHRESQVQQSTGCTLLCPLTLVNRSSALWPLLKAQQDWENIMLDRGKIYLCVCERECVCVHVCVHKCGLLKHWKNMPTLYVNVFLLNFF